jgi:cell division protein FtsI (penicillin-binding protein 3)
MTAGFQHRTRLLAVVMGFAALWSLLLLRAAWIQLTPNERLEALKRRQYETSISLSARRGDIVDRAGRELAASTGAWSIFADPSVIEAPRRTARQMGAALKMTPKEMNALVKTLTSNPRRPKRFIWIERQIDRESMEKISGLKLRGVGVVEEPKRMYPNQRLLAQVLGFVGREGHGLEGIEMKYNDALEATQKKLALQRDARGRPLVVNGQVFAQAPDGATLRLTIDRDLQYVVESEIARAMQLHEAEAGVGVVLDARTSEILALASLPTFDPNSAAKASATLRRNRAVTDLFEPGSTMKTFLVAGAIEAGLVDPNSKLDGENGQLRVGDRVIREADAQHKWGVISVADALAYSSNVISAKLALRLGDAKLRDIMMKFGFAERSGVDLPGEARGVLHALPWRDHLLANVSFGHGISATALQIANAYAVIANGGWLNKPFVVKAVSDPEHGEVAVGQAQAIRRVLSEDTARKMRAMLMGVTAKEGTGWKARVPGFPVAGKTGTAQRVADDGRGYEPGAYIASFGGFLPANDPRFVIYIALDRPKKEYYASAVAAPVFARIGQFAVRQAGLVPVMITAKNVVRPDAAARARNPDADAKLWREEHGAWTREERVEAKRKAEERRRAYFTTSAGTSLLNMSGLVGDFAPTDWEEWRTSAENSLRREVEAEAGGIRIPEVAGLSLREAMDRFVAAGIPWSALEVQGSGFVASSSPSSGENWVAGRKVRVKMGRP